MAMRVYSNIKDLNLMIERQNTFDNACNTVFEYYIKKDNKTPTIEYLKRERVRMKQWLYKSEEMIEFIENLRLSCQYLKDISLEVFLEDYNGG
jgi:hypothetical protein